jgi:hypothetical protein
MNKKYYHFETNIEIEFMQQTLLKTFSKLDTKLSVSFRWKLA